MQIFSFDLSEISGMTNFDSTFEQLILFTGWAYIYTMLSSERTFILLGNLKMMLLRH